MRTLGNFLEYSFGPGSRAEATKLFSRLELPMPGKDEYEVTHDGGILVFINPVACVLRLQTKSKAKKRLTSAALLKPLGEISGEHIQAEINPGVQCAIALEVEKPHCRSLKIKNKENNKKLSRIVAAEGNRYWDSASRNLVYLPTREGEFTFDHPYIVDMDAIKKSKDAPAEKTEPAPSTRSYQDVLYRGLRQSFSRLMVKDKSLQPFWNNSVAAQQNGILVRAWENLEIYEAKESAAKYEERLKRRHRIHSFN